MTNIELLAAKQLRASSMYCFILFLNTIYTTQIFNTVTKPLFLLVCSVWIMFVRIASYNTWALLSHMPNLFHLSQTETCIYKGTIPCLLKLLIMYPQYPVHIKLSCYSCLIDDLCLKQWWAVCKETYFTELIAHKNHFGN